MNTKEQFLSFKQSPDEVRAICDKEQGKLLEQLNTIGAQKIESVHFGNSMVAMELALTQFGIATTPVTFLKYVSGNAAVRKTADECETSVQKMFVDVFIRADLYLVLKSLKDSKQKLDAEAAFLLNEAISSFERNGLGLDPEKQKIFVEKKKQLVAIETEFSKNLVEWKDPLEVELADLEGLPDNYKSGLKKAANGKYLITLDYPSFYPFMEQAKSQKARQMLEIKFWNRGGKRNKELLDQALKLRKELATLLGFKNHAEFVLAKRMATRSEEVMQFLNRLKEKLVPKGREEIKTLESLKKEISGTTDSLQSFEWRYFDTKLKIQKYQVDSEVIRQYFPAETVIKGMFDIYQTLLGVRFERVKTAPVWHSSVEFYRVIRNDKTVALFYMDLYPREGKYGHAAAFPLIQGYKKTDGSYQIPVSAIVANFTAPNKDVPSLLEHDEVETLFHEFGHIMHQVLTTARYATHSGTSVKNDFVEAPSQMLENWVWSKESLIKMSGHYKTKVPLPDDLIEKLIKAKLVNAGIRYLRQLSYALIDMTYHTTEGFDATEVYKKITSEIMMIPIPDNTSPQASFGHVMGGYDAGYYGYLWSKVYAQDMFTRFEKEGLLNPTIGAEYLKWILEPGGLKEPAELIKGFLGREPNDTAFLKSIGL